MGNKVWFIRPDEADEPRAEAGKSAAPAQGSRPTPEAAPVSGNRSAPDGAPAPRGKAPADSKRDKEKGSPSLTVLAYMLGPLAILATRDGRRSKFWISVAAISIALLGFIIWRASAILSPGPRPGVDFFIWFLIACIATLAGFAAWARGVFLLGRDRGWHMRRLPQPVRHPGTAGILGLIIPGYGLFIAGHPRRAVCALVMACAASVSALSLWHAPALWRWNQAAGSLAMPSDALERMFLAMGAIAALGAMAWIVQWLDGVRLAGYRTGSDEGTPGNWAAVALLAALVAFFAMFHPTNLAETIDRFAVSTRLDGLRVIPLYASETAMRLDPSEPRYAVHAIEINDDLGRVDAARAMRRNLEERWKPYERMVERYGSMVEGPFPSLTPSGPASAAAPGNAESPGGVQSK